MDNIHTIRAFRPHRTPPEQLEKTFVAREPLLQEILQRLQQWRAGNSRQHYLFIGPRGIGKTNLLRLLEYRIEKNPELNRKWYTVVFSEEAYGVTKIADLLLNGLRILAEKSADPDIRETYEKIKHDVDDQRVVDLSLDAFKKFHSKSGCGVLFMVENVNRVFESRSRIEAELHLLRKILIEEEWIILVSTSPTFLKSVTDPERPLFEFFQVILLEELSTRQQQEMLEKIARLEKKDDFIDNYLNKLRPQLQAFYHFTGGNPRLTLMLYDLIVEQRITQVKIELDNLLDQLTPFYQDRMKEISDQEAKLLEIMALLDEGSSPKDLAMEMRMDIKQVSALLTRLARAGYIRPEPRRQKRTVYIFPERFFRIWHQMNHSRQARGRIQYLLEFFTSWYASPEERDMIWEKLSTDFRLVLQENDEERSDELAEFMDYIAEISAGEEKYKRMFDRITQVYELKGFAAAEKELAELDKERNSDGDYFLHKGLFLFSKTREKKYALKALQAADRLKPDDIIILFNLCLLFRSLRRNEQAERYERRIIDLLREKDSSYRTMETGEMLLRIFQDENDYRLVRIASVLLRRYANRIVIDRIIDIVQLCGSAVKKQIGITTLGFLREIRTVPVLIDFLKDKAGNVRGSAAYALGMIGDRAAVPHLIACLKDKDNKVCGSAAHALGLIGDSAAVPALIACLKDESNNVRGSAAHALGKIGDRAAAPALIACLEDEASDVRGSAASALGMIGDNAAISALIACLKDENKITRGSAATALGKIRDNAAVPALIAYLKDKDNIVRGSAAHALGKIGDNAAVPRLIACLKDEADNVRGSAATALGKIGDRAAVPHLIACLKDEANDVRGSAATALGKIGDRAAVPALIACLIDEDNINRGSATTALGRIGDSAAVPHLIACLKDEDKDVRISASIALGKIASQNPIPNIDRLQRSLSEIKNNNNLPSIIKASRELLDSAFRSGQEAIIEAAVNQVLEDYKNGADIFEPYVLALAYIKSGRDPGFIERQHPEMRDAIRLLVQSFDQRPAL